MEAWLRPLGDTFSWHPPAAGAICWAHYRGAIPALEIVEKLRAQHGVLLCPGDHFGMPGFLRFGYGGGVQHFLEALPGNGRGPGGVVFPWRGSRREASAAKTPGRGCRRRGGGEDPANEAP